MPKLLVGAAILVGAALLAFGFLNGTGDDPAPARPATSKEAPMPDAENPLAVDPNDKVEHTDAEWRELLTPEEYRILRQAGTEMRGTGEYDHVFTAGTYVCKACGLPLFSSDAKFDSGCGWPAFFEPYDGLHVTEHVDTSFGMRRVEVRCKRCGGHLGHVFPDAPQTPTGMRYCINSASIELLEGVLKDPREGGGKPSANPDAGK
jgi:peptide-methionine (R)-S-oxide reductase